MAVIFLPLNLISLSLSSPSLLKERGLRPAQTLCGAYATGAGLPIGCLLAGRDERV